MRARAWVAAFRERIFLRSYIAGFESREWERDAVCFSSSFRSLYIRIYACGFSLSKVYTYVCAYRYTLTLTLSPSTRASAGPSLFPIMCAYVLLFSFFFVLQV